MNCESCNVTFANSKQLRHHMNHSIEHVGKQYSCEYCGVKFSTQSNMNAHVRKKHIGSITLSHECTFCFKALKSARGLAVHQSQSRKCSASSKLAEPTSAPSVFGCVNRIDNGVTTVKVGEHSSVPALDVYITCVPTDVSESPCTHSTILFVPARGGTGQEDSEASRIERSCFVIVSMAEFFRRGHGSNTKVTIIIPRGIADTEFEAAAFSLELMEQWREMKSECVLVFESYETLVGAFREAKSRNGSVSNNITSLLIIGHGGFDRCQILYGADIRCEGTLKRPSHLVAPRLSGLIDISGAKIVHIMTCKAAKLLVTMTQTKRAMYNDLHNDDTAFVAYGGEDITTVPVVISRGNR